MDNKRLSDFYTGFIVAIAVISALLYFAHSDKRKGKYEEIQKRMESASGNPNPADMQTFCDAADPDLNAKKLFDKPQKHLGRRICLSGKIEQALGRSYDDDFAYYNIRSSAATVVLKIAQPPDYDRLFELSDFVSCGGYEVVPPKGSYFDYYPHVRCAFIYSDKLKDNELSPELKEALIENKWRKSIIAAYGGRTMEIWLSPQDDQSVTILASPEGEIDLVVLEVGQSPETGFDYDPGDNDVVTRQERCSRAQEIGNLLFEKLLGTDSTAAQEWLGGKMLNIGGESPGEKESFQTGNAAISFSNSNECNRLKLSIEF